MEDGRSRHQPACRRRRNGCHRRRVRFWQKRDSPVCHASSSRRALAHGRPDPARWNGPPEGERKDHALHPRRFDRDDLPGADDVAQPGLHDRQPDRRGARPASRAVVEGSGSGSPAPDGTRPHSGGEGPAQRISAQVLWRHAPARHDRHGACLSAKTAHRRRAYDGARRDHPGRDPSPVARIAA